MWKVTAEYEHRCYAEWITYVVVDAENEEEAIAAAKAIHNSDYDGHSWEAECIEGNAARVYWDYFDK